MSEITHILHPFGPVFDKQSKILILGSFPSVLSREISFFYGHPQNRFWTVVASIFGCDTPGTIDEKRAFLLQNHIALWDVIQSCDIKGSDDSSIKNALPNDLTEILETAQIQAIFVNGKTAEKYYNKLTFPVTGRKAILLPSTSPANAAYSVDRLKTEWQKIKL